MEHAVTTPRIAWNTTARYRSLIIVQLVGLFGRWGAFGAVAAFGLWPSSAHGADKGPTVAVVNAIVLDTGSRGHGAAVANAAAAGVIDAGWKPIVAEGCSSGECAPAAATAAGASSALVLEGWFRGTEYQFSARLWNAGRNSWQVLLTDQTCPNPDCAIVQMESHVREQVAVGLRGVSPKPAVSPAIPQPDRNVTSVPNVAATSAAGSLAGSGGQPAGDVATVAPAPWWPWPVAGAAAVAAGSGLWWLLAKSHERTGDACDATALTCSRYSSAPGVALVATGAVLGAITASGWWSWWANQSGTNVSVGPGAVAVTGSF